MRHPETVHIIMTLVPRTGKECTHGHINHDTARLCTFWDSLCRVACPFYNNTGHCRERLEHFFRCTVPVAQR
jgi:hypothetical protein